MRFELRQGKFGSYFYDSMAVYDMPLSHVLEKLNQLEEFRKNVICLKTENERLRQDNIKLTQEASKS